MIVDINKNHYDPFNDPNHIDVAIAGTIKFSEDINESLIGQYNFGKSIGKCKIEVFSSEGSIPHFHVSNSDSTFDCCTEIYSARYFDHGYHTSKLTNRQCSELDSYLRSYDIDYPGNQKITIWDSIVFLWKKSNPDCIFPNNKKVKLQPNYKNLNF